MCDQGSGGRGSGPPATNPSLSCPNPTAFNQIGGYEQLAAAYARAIPSRTVPNTSCHLPRADAMHMFRDPYTGDLPWTGMTFGLTIMATWYWCTDQVSVRIVAHTTCLPSRVGSGGSWWPICQSLAWPHEHLHGESGRGQRPQTGWLQARGHGVRDPCGPGGPGPSV